jgi:anti-anti-sigma factor
LGKTGIEEDRLMDITVSQAQGRVPVTVIKLAGQLDGQTYQDLINKAREAYAAGARDFLMDMTDLSYISSAGLVALHSAAMLVRGEELPNPESGWSALKSMPKTGSGGKQAHIKLFGLRSEVQSVLEMVGFSAAFDIFTNREEAIKSF